ncbi:hypothetical protein [Elstera cyanobacteriorum]|uniref:hypothetical protein n=1 Tax=Elstera cyanobacteriorum TaxID=2022747 RepID=UPI002355FA5C|nr:hypothetical protein [Elstera cyanobacteriorum]MCK6441798.1 hypothetical protein [Elstera cyanobacteriorum]
MSSIFGTPDFDSPRLDGMSSFEYLNRSTREAAARIRCATGEWLSRYPASERDRLISRIRSYDDVEHYSAYFELILHEVLIQRGCRVEVELQLGTNERCPDFLVYPPNARRFVLEAVTASGISDEMRSKRRYLSEILRAIDEIPESKYSLFLRWKGFPDNNPSLKSLISKLRQWLECLEPNSADEKFEWQCPGLSLEVVAMPRSKPGTRLIGAKMPELTQVRAKYDIARRVRDKAGAYGDLSMPFVVAVNSLDTRADGSDFLDALLGSEAALPCELADGNFGYVSTRMPDGVFYGKGGPKNTRVSAVIGTCCLTPWHLAQSLKLIKHPNARHPLRRLPLRASTPLRSDDDRWRRAPAVAQLLGLTSSSPS